MKKILFLLPIFILLIGCSKEDTPVVTSISFDKNEISIKVGESETLKVIHEPSDLPVPSYTWESSNKDVATITNGKVTAMSVGEATIKVTAAELGLTASCKIKVNPVEAETIVLNTTNQELKIGDEFQLTATIEPENTTDKSITWESNDDKIATVTEEGLVKAVGVGKAIITVTSGNISVTCNIEVEPIQVTGISLSHEDIEIEITDEFELQATISPEDATNKKVIWQSKNPNIAEVDDNGNITGVNEGNTIVTAKTEEGNFSASCNVTVNLKGLRLTMSDIKMLPNTEELIWVLYSTSDKAYVNATWSSSNPNVARVIGDGPGTNSALIKALSIGTAIITATSADGSKTATCTVNVDDITSFISLSFQAGTPGPVTINGFVTGDIYSVITNNSNQTIELTSLYIYDGYSGRLVGYSTDPTLLGNLSAGSSTNLGMKFNSVYYPIFKWTFKWNNNEYEIQHQYITYRSTSVPVKQWNKIEPVNE
jgi:uncharacterized protein YjdB